MIDSWDIMIYITNVNFGVLSRYKRIVRSSSLNTTETG